MNKFSRTMTRQRWQLLLVSPADNVGGVKNRETGDEQLSEECLMRVIIIILVVTIITFMIHHHHHQHHHHQHHHHHHHQDHYHHNNCDNNTIVLLTGLTLTKCMITRIVCLQLTTGQWVYFTGLTLTKTMITRGVCLQTHYVAKLHSCKMMAEIKQVSCKTNVSGAQALMLMMINRSSTAIWKVCLLTYYLAKLVSPQQCSVQQWWRRLNKFRTKQMCLECEARLG